MTYDELQLLYDKEVFITEMDLKKVSGLKGLYVDGCIAIEKNMTLKKKSCVLAEEIGHHLTTVGNILDLSDTNNRKQERKARVIAYDIHIRLSGLIGAFEAGCKNLYETAEFLDVTENFLQDAIRYYKEKYGLCAKMENYIIYFEPVGVMKLL